MPECRSCGRQIRWMVTAVSGKRIPLDPAPAQDGNIRLDDEGVAHALNPLEAEAARSGGEALFASHFVTCPDADRWRRR